MSEFFPHSETTVPGTRVLSGPAVTLSVMGLVTGTRTGVALFSRRTVDLCRVGSCLCPPR